jgi:rhodanese-related sulfurtransferase
MIAQNQECGLVAVPPLADWSGARILDVRHPEEVTARPLTGAEVVCVPQERVRTESATLDGSDWLVVCERGTRSSEVARWLLSRGIRANYLGGGLRWRALARHRGAAFPPAAAR